jgi:uncharacterized protein (TIGR03000 family)
MFNNRILSTVLAALALLLLAASPAIGQHPRGGSTAGAGHQVHVAPAYRHYGHYPGYHVYRGYYPWYLASPVYPGYASYYHYGYAYAPGISVYPTPWYSYYYAPPAVTQAPMPLPENVARVHVIVPPDALVWFEGELDAQTGTDREFVSPPLEPGKVFTYEIRARWTENDRTVEQTRRVSVRANGATTADFNFPAK